MPNSTEEAAPTNAPRRPRIFFVGAGGIGSYTGAHLARAGHDVTLVDSYPAHIEAIRAQGLTSCGISDEDNFTVPIRALHVGEVQQIAREAPVDIAIIATKSYDTDWAVALMRPYLAEDAYVVSMQNCLNEDRIAALVGRDRVLGSVVGIGVELIEPGKVMRTNRRSSIPNTYTQGELTGGITPRLETLTRMLADVDTSVTTSNLLDERWTKLCMNIMRNGVSAASGLSVNECDADSVIRHFSYRLVSEAIGVAAALGHQVHEASNLDMNLVARAGEDDRDARDAIDAALARASASYRSNSARPSMGQDIIKGRRTEIEFINGYVVEKGRALGINTPHNSALTTLVERIYRGELAPSPEHIHTLAAAIGAGKENAHA